MPFCVKCRLNVSKPCFINSADPTTECAVVASDEELLRRCNFQRLAMAWKSLELSRRDIPNFIADVLYDFDGRIIQPDGSPFELSDTAIDDAFRNDGSFRWLSDFIGFADRPPMQTPQKRLLERLRLIDLALRLLLTRRSPGRFPPKPEEQRGNL